MVHMYSWHRGMAFLPPLKPLETLETPPIRPRCTAGAGYSLFAGKEVARALAKVAVDEKECNDKSVCLMPLHRGFCCSSTWRVWWQQLTSVQQCFTRLISSNATRTADYSRLAGLIPLVQA